jgi:hypothetical protein
LNSKPENLDLEPTLFELESPKYDETKSFENGRILILDSDTNGDGVINFDDLEWTYLEGNGDFASAEVTSLRDEADIIVTNPPFSLFRKFLAWLVEAKKQFVIIGNMNAITYKEVFPLLQENRLWLGATANGSDLVFAVPSGYEIDPKDKDKAARLGYVGDYTRLGNACWFTTLEHNRRHEALRLMTEEDNIRYGRTGVKGVGYQKYDNYDAIEVPYTESIPSDFEGVMGVPITFLGKYNPEQFQIVGMAKRGAGDPALKTKVYTAEDHPKYSDLNAGPVLVKPEGLVNTYPRILIRKRRPD